VGTLAYEMYGMPNPFYNKELNINSSSYEENQLPALPSDVPQLIQRLVANILSKSPSNVSKLMHLKFTGVQIHFKHKVKK